jgi:transaldolase
MTIPEATLRAFADHGHIVAFEPDDPRPGETLRRARNAGIDLDAITTKLEREGVRSFCDSHRDLLDCIATKVERPAVYTHAHGLAVSDARARLP